TNQRLVNCEEKSTEPTGTNCNRPWSGNPASFRDIETALLEKALQGSKREEASVSDIENSSLAIVELPKQQHESDDEESNIGCADDQRYVWRKFHLLA